ncbi:MAG: NUDIX hydrolase [Pseudomonadota bacterium]
MSDQRYEVRHNRKVHTGFVNLDIFDATITKGPRRVDISREVHDHGHGACVLPYDPARKTALLVRQLRVPAHLVTGDGLILEAAAGVLDPEDPSPAFGAQREAREELGYDVHDLRPVGRFFTIPGLVTEQMSCFLATYDPSDKVDGDTGADADEVLDVEEWTLADLWTAYEDGVLTDLKTVVCLLTLRMEEPSLFT